MSGRFQTTLKNTAVCRGVGLHSGADVDVCLRPAPAGAGVLFRRMDLLETDASPQPQRIEAATITASPAAVAETRLGTTLRNANGASVATIEHLMAALLLTGVDNVLVEIDGPEVPILDGSAQPFVDAIAAAGVRDLKTPHQAMEITAPFRVEEDGRWIEFTPFDGFRLDVEIDFDDAAIGRQSVCFEDDLAAGLAAARTFCLRQDIDAMRAVGLARGGSLDNAIVVEDGRVLNEGGLRIDNEFARHKALDLLGDLYLLGAPLKGRVRAYKPGHDLNTRAARLLADAEEVWALTPVEELPAVAAVKADKALAAVQV